MLSHMTVATSGFMHDGLCSHGCLTCVQPASLIVAVKSDHAHFRSQIVPTLLRAHTLLFRMCRRQLLLAAQTCSRAIQHSQACGQVQLGPLSLSSQLHAAATPQAHLQQDPSVNSRWKSSAVQQHADGGLQQRHQQWAAARWFSTSLQNGFEEDLRVV
jgi:hypothetical protein